MKTLSEIQNDIKSLSLQLNHLAINIQNIRPEVKKNDLLDMKKIKNISQNYPMEGHYLGVCEEYVKKRYLTLLVLAARIQQSEIEKSLLLINRIALGAGYEEDIADILKDSYTISERSMEEIIDTFSNEPIRMLLILDMLLISAERKKKDSLQFIAEISYFLSINENEMKFLSNLAVIILQNDINLYTENDVLCDNWIHIFDCYLKNFKIDRKLVKVPKNVLIGLGDLHYQVNLEAKGLEPMLLKAGDTICRIKDSSLSNNEASLDSSLDRKLEKKMSDIKGEYKLISSLAGKVYIFADRANQENQTVGIITHPLDKLENARVWFEENK
jgi:hypothetical protein